MEILGGFKRVEEGHFGTNFTNFSIEELDEELIDIVADDREIDEENDYIDLHLSYLLTSRPLFPDQEDLLEEFKAKAHALLLKSPILRRGVIKVLQKTLITRQERKHFQST